MDIQADLSLHWARVSESMFSHVLAHNVNHYGSNLHLTYICMTCDMLSELKKVLFFDLMRFFNSNILIFFLHENTCCGSH